MKKIIMLTALFLILFIMGCTTEVIEVEPPTETDDTAETTPDEVDNITTETVDIDITEDTNDTVIDTTTNITETNTTTINVTTPTTTSNTIEVKEFTFDPKELTIKVGETVTFKNNKPDEGKKANQAEIFKVRGRCGDIPKLTQATAIQPGEEISFTFDQVGSCFYRDVYQGDYVGKVIIE